MILPFIDGGGNTVPSDFAQSPEQALRESHRLDLKRSGISPEQALAAGIYSASEREIQLLLGRIDPVGSGLVIPYFDLAGEPLRVSIRKKSAEYVRVRLDAPWRAEDGDNKPAKYMAPTGAGQHPYVLPSVSKGLRDGGLREIIVTEGEKKALAATTQGFPAIGLSGNWGWKSKDKLDLLPLLADALPPGTTVNLIWDSDAALNMSFASSTRMLHDALRRRGINLVVIVLPQLSAQKTGLDDFLALKGAAALRELIAHSAPISNQRQVTVAELLSSWLNSLIASIPLIDPASVETFLKSAFSKGLVDSVDHMTRSWVLQRMESSTGLNVQAIFEEVVADYLRAEYGVIDENAQTDALAAGAIASLPDGKNVRIVALESKFAWVCAPRHEDTTFPVPLAMLRTAPSNNVVAATPASLADEFIKTRYMTADVCTLRWHRGCFYCWDSGTYRELTENDISAQVMAFLRGKAPARALPGTVTAVIKNLQAENVCYLPTSVDPPCLINSAGIESASNIIPFSNGFFDVAALMTGEDDEKIFKPLSPRLFTTTGRDFEYPPNADCPQWKKFIDEILPDEELKELAQEIFGLSMIADTSFQVFFILLGIGQNGKNVYLDVLAEVVGKANTCCVPVARFGERFALWPLVDALVNIVSEIDVDRNHGSIRIAEDKLKAIVSGDFIEIERKNQDIFKARASARLVFACNALPPIADRSNGIWRRMVILPFDVVIPDDKRDKLLAKKIIATELSGVFLWALEGLLRLQKRGMFNEPAASKAIKAEHRLTCSPEDEFLSEYVRAGQPADFIVIGEIYAAYRSVMSAQGNNYPLAMRKFIQALQRRFPKCSKGKVKGQRGYHGVQFHVDGIPDEKEADNGQAVGDPV